MANLLESGSVWLADQLQTHASTEVVYERGTQQALVRATLGRTEFVLDDGAGAVLRVQSRDFLIRAADLVLGGVPTLPVAGDRIRETQGATTFVYEVNAPGQEPPYRFSDPFRKLLRIHSKHVG